MEILSCNWGLGFSKIERDKKEAGLELSGAVPGQDFPHGKPPRFPFSPFQLHDDTCNKQQVGSFFFKT